MLEKSIATLAATPPPALKNQKGQFLNLREANAHVAALENELGLEPSGPERNLITANLRISILGSLKAARKNPIAPAAVVLPAAPELTPDTKTKLVGLFETVIKGDSTAAAKLYAEHGDKLIEAAFNGYESARKKLFSGKAAEQAEALERYKKLT